MERPAIAPAPNLICRCLGIGKSLIFRHRQIRIQHRIQSLNSAKHEIRQIDGRYFAAPNLLRDVRDGEFFEIALIHYFGTLQAQRRIGHDDPTRGKDNPVLTYEYQSYTWELLQKSSSTEASSWHPGHNLFNLDVLSLVCDSCLSSLKLTPEEGQ